jgi:hypothetical protein
MSFTPLTGGLLAVGVLIVATVVWSRTREKKPRIAGASGPKRFQRPQSKAVKRTGTSSLKGVVIWVTAAVLIAWVALSLANPAKSPEANVPTETVVSQVAPAPTQNSSPFVSGNLTPPPAPGLSLTVTAEASPAPAAGSSQTVAAEVSPAPAPGAGQTLAAEVSPPRATQVQPTPQVQPNQASSGEAAQPVPNPVATGTNIQDSAISISNPTIDSSEPLSSFAPLDQDFTVKGNGNISQGAIAMAPKISRMEPVGRSLGPGALKAKKILEPAPKPEKLTAPAKPTTKPPPLTNSNNTDYYYPVLLGSFRKPEYAERLRTKLVEEGLSVAVFEATLNKDNSIWYRVMSDFFENTKEAEAFRLAIKQRNLVDNPLVFPVKKQPLQQP